jgi:hypothetical protein
MSLALLADDEFLLAKIFKYLDPNDKENLRLADPELFERYFCPLPIKGAELNVDINWTPSGLACSVCKNVCPRTETSKFFRAYTGWGAQGEPIETDLFLCSRTCTVKARMASIKISRMVLTRYLHRGLGKREIIRNQLARTKRILQKKNPSMMDEFKPRRMVNAITMNFFDEKWAAENMRAGEPEPVVERPEVTQPLPDSQDEVEETCGMEIWPS